MKWVWLSLALVCAAPCPCAAAGAPEQILRWLDDGDYARAEERLKQLQERAEGDDRHELSFLLAFALYKQNKAAEARGYLALIPDTHDRYEDMQMLSEFLPSLAADDTSPMLRILLGRGRLLAAEWDGRAHRFDLTGIELKVDGRSVSAPHRVRPLRQEFFYGGRIYRGGFDVLIESGELLLVNMLPIELYLAGVLKNEISPSWHVEALKAQAIVARTYAYVRLAESNGTKPYELTADVASQVYKGRLTEDARMNDAIGQTRGLVLTHGGAPAQVFYHSESGGRTESSKEIWGRAYPYLAVVRDEHAGKSPHAEWEAEFSEAELIAAVASMTGKTIESVSDVTVTDRTDSGRAKTVTVEYGSRQSLELQASGLRLALGPDRLRSLLVRPFRYHRRSGKLQARGRGWGHGVGLPQWSAKAAAERGHSAEQILDQYFPGTKLEVVY